MSDLDRYIDSLPIDTCHENVLREMITKPTRSFTPSELAGRLNYSTNYTKDALMALWHCGVLGRTKDTYGQEGEYYLASPRLLQHLGLDRPTTAA